MAAYEPTIFAQWQSDLQVNLRPSMWIPKLRDIHCHKISGVISGHEAHEVMAALEAATRSLTDKFQLRPSQKQGTTFYRVYAYTKVEWLDVLEFRLRKTGDTTLRIEVEGFSSGVVPVSVPLAPLLNSAFCWLPFKDHGFNKRRVEHYLRELEKSGIHVATD
ncbi:uncharacterized protein MONBRDRAFT_33039 [Monosiga brevicollis MX1]|uniref:Uncharacterized protein n=1 Tax=Monosiga brevicollis TaxID=81824 RepID=A9V362_MONBE|nr:uncharacterized protein MONBRDRAFT_33039 [Monosiga brevicollis MX1]EDQ88005.1 predicted protein [Monosiga brevicollis MX1]|eukprot:XP_001747081.1 hypothetical protein [Monosiga brevicollis MX1]